MATVQLQITGMSCAGCAQSIERRLMSTGGVQAATVNLSAATADVTYNEMVVTPDALVKAVEVLGFGVLHGEGQG